MNGRTLFRTYDVVMSVQAAIRHTRTKGSVGIAVDTDPAALKYQRLVRPQRKLYHAIMRKLGMQEHYARCLICGWPSYLCNCVRGFQVPHRFREEYE